MKMWDLHGIEPEEINYRTMAVTYPGYPLRPEIVESTYYLYHYASLEAPAHRGKASLLGRRAVYLRMGGQLFRDFVKHCRTDEGYAALEEC